MPKASREDILFRKKIGARIKELREQKGILQSKLGDMLDKEKGNMSRLESGRDNPTALTIKYICKALNISLKEFFDSDF